MYHSIREGRDGDSERYVADVNAADVEIDRQRTNASIFRSSAGEITRPSSSRAPTKIDPKSV